MLFGEAVEKQLPLCELFVLDDNDIRADFVEELKRFTRIFCLEHLERLNAFEDGSDTLPYLERCLVFFDE